MSLLWFSLKARFICACISRTVALAFFVKPSSFVTRLVETRMSMVSNVKPLSGVRDAFSKALLPLFK